MKVYYRIMLSATKTIYDFYFEKGICHSETTVELLYPKIIFLNIL